MADTFVKIASVTVGSGGTATIDFNSIPTTYTDLQIMVSLRRSTSAVGDFGIKFNGATGYFYRHLKGDGTNRYAGGSTNSSFYYVEDTMLGTNYTANTFNNGIVYIYNYNSSTVRKAILGDVVTENNATESWINISGAYWDSTSQITSITLYPSGGYNFVEYSTATLYGITAA
jgi:hypothetical protein